MFWSPQTGSYIFSIKMSRLLTTIASLRERAHRQFEKGKKKNPIYTVMLRKTENDLVHVSCLVRRNKFL